MKNGTPKNEDDVTLSDLVGSSFALVQHGIDLAVGAGLKSLRKSAESPKKKNRSSNRIVRTASGFARGMIGFVARAGDTYMQTYDNLKKDHKS